MGFKKEVISQLTKIEIQLALNTKVLDEHHKRSTMLEERVRPLESSQVFFNKLMKSIVAIIGIVAGCASIYHYLLK